MIEPSYVSIIFWYRYICCVGYLNIGGRIDVQASTSYTTKVTTWRMPTVKEMPFSNWRCMLSKPTEDQLCASPRKMEKGLQVLPTLVL